MSEYGQVWITALYDADGDVQSGTRIDQADPTALIAWDLLDLIRAGRLPFVEADEHVVTFTDTDACERITYRIEGFVGAYGGYALRRLDRDEP